MNEFQIINKYFNKHQSFNNHTIIGIGDDAAVLNIKKYQKIIMSIDTMVENIHFESTLNPFYIGYKIVAINISDCVSMGAIPLWLTLSLSLPIKFKTNNWLTQFSNGLYYILNKYNIKLIGGNITSSNTLIITAQINGYINKTILLRSGAKNNDDVYVTGNLGDAYLGRLILKNQFNNKKLLPIYKKILIKKFLMPIPKIHIIKKLCLYITSCIDISDGLLDDLNHLIKSSKVGVNIIMKNIPISYFLNNILSKNDINKIKLISGDDYELCFTAKKKFFNLIKLISIKNNIQITKIGEINNSKKIYLHSNDNYNLYDKYINKGYMHFK